MCLCLSEAGIFPSRHKTIYISLLQHSNDSIYYCALLWNKLILLLSHIIISILFFSLYYLHLLYTLHRAKFVESLSRSTFSTIKCCSTLRTSLRCEIYCSPLWRTSNGAAGWVRRNEPDHSASWWWSTLFGRFLLRVVWKIFPAHSIASISSAGCRPFWCCVVSLCVWRKLGENLDR